METLHRCKNKNGFCFLNFTLRDTENPTKNIFEKEHLLRSCMPQ